MPLKNKDMLDLEQITKKVREIALQGGAFLRNERSSFDRGRVEKKNGQGIGTQNCSAIARTGA